MLFYFILLYLLFRFYLPLLFYFIFFYFCFFFFSGCVLFVAYSKIPIKIIKKKTKKKECALVSLEVKVVYPDLPSVERGEEPVGD